MSFIPPREKIGTLTAAGTFVDFDVVAQWFAITEASENILVAINDEAPFTFFKGGFISLPFSDIRKLRITAAPGATVNPHVVSVLFGVGEFRDARWNVVSSTSSAISIRSAATLSAPLADIVLAAGVAQYLFNADPLTRCVRISNTGANPCRFGGTTALLATQGELLNPGETREIYVTGDILAQSALGTTINRGREIY